MVAELAGSGAPAGAAGAARSGGGDDGVPGVQLLPRWLRSATREHVPTTSLQRAHASRHAPHQRTRDARDAPRGQGRLQGLDDPPPSYTWSESRPRRAWGAVHVPAAPGWPAPLPPLPAAPWTMSPPQRRPSHDYDPAGTAAGVDPAPAPSPAAGVPAQPETSVDDQDHVEDGRDAEPRARAHGQDDGLPEASPRKRAAGERGEEDPRTPGRTTGRTPGRENWRLGGDPSIGHVWPSDWGSE